MDVPLITKPAAPTVKRAGRLPGLAAVAPLMVLIGLTSIQGLAKASDEGFSTTVTITTSTNWLIDAPFQSPAPEEAEVVAEHAAAPHARQTADVLMPDRVAVRRMRIGGLYGP